MTTTKTTLLLAEVQQKLVEYTNFLVQDQPFLSYTFEDVAHLAVDKGRSTCFKELSDIINHTKAETTPASRLLGSLIHYMTNTFCFIPTEKITKLTWPCAQQYRFGNPSNFYYLNHKIEICILAEKKQGAESSTYFVVFNFTHDELAYIVKEFPVCKIPKLDGKANVADEMYCLREIFTMLNETVRTFCSEVVTRKSKFDARKEFHCTDGVYPKFSDSLPGKPPSKMIKIDPDLVFMPEFYLKLRAIYENATEKPEDSARLFALIHEILVFSHQCDSDEKNSWPGGLQYGNTVINIRFQGDVVKIEGNTATQSNFFDISLLDASSVFYFNIKAAISEHRVVKKVSKLLVPTYDRMDVIREKERIDNISTWLGSVTDEFVMKVANNTYKTPVLFYSRSSTEPSSREELEEDTLSGPSTST